MGLGLRQGWHGGSRGPIAPIPASWAQSMGELKACELAGVFIPHGAASRLLASCDTLACKQWSVLRSRPRGAASGSCV